MRICLGLTVALLVVRVGAAWGADRERHADELVVHEWGTFTSLQDEDGRELGGINIDDEPVPDFVHDLSEHVLNPTFLTNRYWAERMKGVPRRYPRVTMRLETPVIYFHLPQGVEKPVEVDVDASFRGGWLTEFYPDAQAEAPGLRGDFGLGELTPSTVGSLRWENLLVGTDVEGPRTDAPVWTTPRKVECDGVTTAKGESEQYLFYRGVAQLAAPLRVVTDPQTGRVEVQRNFGAVQLPEGSRIPGMWLVDIGEDGRVSFSERKDVPIANRDGATVAAFEPSSNLEGDHPAIRDMLKKFMWIALTRNGLYPDEATAMIETWHRAYFESPGRRLFYIVPREWTDHHLPLEISEADRIERVMIGRIELVTAEHRRVLAKIAAGEAPDASWVEEIPPSEARTQFFAGRSGFGDLGVEIPEHYRLYLELGRFRNALVIDEEKRRPTKALTKFIDAYGLRPYRWEEIASAASEK